MSSSVQGLATISGVASGLNYNSIVSQLMAVEQLKITDLQNQQTTVTNQENAMNTLSGYLSTLQSQAQSMANSFNFMSYTTSMTSGLSATGTAAGATASSASSLLSASASSSATTGTHTIEVDALAQAQSWGGQTAVTDSSGTTVTSSTTALGLTAGSFTITGSNGVAQSVQVASTDSLQNIIDNINALDTGSTATGVTASAIYTGSGYQLVLTSDKTGASNAFTTSLTSSYSNLGFYSSATSTSTVSTIQTAQDATAIIDGYTVTNSSNTLSSAISGVTLNLLQADPNTTVTLNTGVDTQAITQNIQSFVTDYNQVIDFINQQESYDSTTNTSGPLAGDPLITNIRSELSSALLTSIPGITSSYNSLVQVGVTPDSNGDLSIDSTTLDSLLSSNPSAVMDVFAATGTSANGQLSFINYGSNTVSGSYAVNITQAAQQATLTGSAISTTTGLTTTATGLTSTVIDNVTVTDGLNQTATFNLTANETLSSIVSAMNTEFQTTYTQQVTETTGWGASTTSATSLSSLGLAAGDTITIGGTDHSGSSVSSTYTVGSSDTVATLLTAIQADYNQSVTATLDSSGNIVLTDGSSGLSSLGLSMTYNGTSATFTGGTASKTTTGRYAMNLTASATSGNALQITSNDYGSSSSFYVNESADALGFSGAITTTAYNNQTIPYTGKDVAGTIGGLAATGSAQILTGTSGSADGLSLMYTGSTTGSIGTLTASLGIGAQYDNLINTMTMANSGLIPTDLTAMQTNYNNLSTDITNVQTQMTQEQDTLIAQFQSMESLIASLNTTGSYLSQVSSMLSNTSGSSSSSSFK